MSKKVISLVKAQSLAERILVHRQHILKLRSQILPSIRKAIQDNYTSLGQCKNTEIKWMVDKVHRGYFGTDVKSNQLLSLIQELRKETDERNKDD